MSSRTSSREKLPGQYWRRFGIGGVLSILLLLATGCAGLKPAPTYNRERPSQKHKTAKKTSPPPSRPASDPERAAGNVPPSSATPATKSGSSSSVASPTPSSHPTGGEGLASMGVLPDALADAVNSWLGSPYKFGGNGARGIDCSGYVRVIMKAVYGIELPRSSQEQFREGAAVIRSALKRGDLVFFSTGGGTINHVGIYLGDDRFTHASNSDGVTIDSMDAPYYRKRYKGARRVIE